MSDQTPPFPAGTMPGQNPPVPQAEPTLVMPQQASFTGAGATAAPVVAGPAAGPWGDATSPAAVASPRLPSTWGSPVGPLVAGLAGLLASYLGAIVLVLLAVAGAALAADSDGGAGEVASGLQESTDSGVGAFLKGILQLVSMAFRNPLGARVMGLGGAVTIPVLSILAVFCLTTWWAGRLSTRTWAVGSGTGNLVLAGLAGLVNGILLDLLARLAAFEVDQSEGLLDIHSAGVTGFVLCFVLTTACVAAGRARGVEHHSLPNHPLVREVLRAARAFTYHVLLLGGLVTIAAWVALMVRIGDEVGLGAALASLLLLPLLAGNLVAWAFGLATLGHLGVSTRGMLDNLDELGLDLGPVDLSNLSGHLSLGLFDAPWWVALLGLAGSALAICLTCLFWAARRRVGGNNQQAQAASWLVLPAVYLAGGCLLAWASSISARSTGIEVGRVSIGLALWWPLLLAVVGLLIEVASRYLRDPLRQVVPVKAYWWGPESDRPALPGLPAPATAATAAPVVAPAPAPAPAPQTVGHEVAATADGPVLAAAALGAAAATQAPVSEAPVAGAPLAQAATEPVQPLLGATAQPISEEQRRRNRRIAMVVGIVLGALAVFSIAVAVLNRTVYGPKQQAVAVLDAIGEGKASAALDELGTAAPEGSHLLLADDVYAKAGGGMTSYTIGEVDKKGKEATVSVQTKLGQTASDVTIQLRRSGKVMGLFDRWQVQDMGLGAVAVTVPEGARTLEVNGTSIDVAQVSENGSVVLPAFPGEYTVKLPDQSKYLVGQSVTQTVGWTMPGQPETLRTSLSEQFTTDVKAKVKAIVDECIRTGGASLSARCPMGTVLMGSDARNVSWKLLQEPTITLGELGYEGEVPITTDVEGQAQVTYQEQELFGETWESKSETTSVRPSGTAQLTGEKFDTIEVTLS